MAGCRDGKDVESMEEFVLLKTDKMNHIYNTNNIRGVTKEVWGYSGACVKLGWRGHEYKGERR